MSFLWRVITPKNISKQLGRNFVVAAILAVTVVVPLAQAQAANEEVVAQKPLVSTVIDGMALTTNKANVPIAITMPQGINAPLEIVNLHTMKRLLMEEQRTDGVEVATQAYVTLPNRHVLVGTTGGYVYDVDPDKLTAVEQTPAQGASISFMAGVAGEGDMAYFVAQTASGVQLYQYNGDSTVWRSLASLPAATGGIAYNNGTLYVGGGTTSPIITAVNDQTGNKTTLPVVSLPAGVTGLKALLATGNFLYLSTPNNLTLTFDVTSNSVVDQHPSFGVLSSAYPQTVDSNIAVPVAVSTTATTSATSSTQSADTTQPSQTAANSNTSTTSATTTGQTQSPTDASATANSLSTGTSQTTQAASTDATADTTSAVAVVHPTPVVPTTSASSTDQTTSAAASTIVVATPDASVYYGALSTYNPTTKSTTAFVNQQGLQPVANDCWIDATHCVVYDASGRVGLVDSAAHTFKLTSPSPFIGGYHKIDMTTVGSNNTVYALSSIPGTAVFQTNPTNPIDTKLAAGSNSGLTSLLPSGNVVVAGTANGQLMTYDPSTKTTTPQFGAGVTVASGEISVLANDGTDTVAFGASQTGTQTTGAIGVYSLATQSVVMTPQTVLNGQTVGSLVANGHIAYIGGANAAAGATLVAYDMATHTILAHQTPASGVASISSLVVGSNGNVYGIAGGTVFEVNPQTLAILSSQSLSVTQTEPGNIVIWHGQLVAAVAGKVYDLDASTLSSTYVTTGTNVSVDSQGDYYYTRSGTLYRMMAPSQPVAAITKVRKAVPRFNFSAIDIRIRIGIVALFGLLLFGGLFLKLHQRRVAAHATYRVTS